MTSDKWVNPLGATKSQQAKTWKKAKATIKKAYKKVVKQRIARKNQLIKGPAVAAPFRCRKFNKMQYNRSTQLCCTTTVNRLGPVFLYSLINLNKPYVSQITGDPLPYGFNDVRLDWKSYKVHGAFIKVTVPPNVVSKNLKLIFSAVNSSGQGSLTHLNDYEGYIGQPNTWVLDTNTDRGTVFTKYINIARLEGLTKPQYNNSIDLKYIGNYQQDSSIVTDDPKSVVEFQFSLVNTFDNTQQCFECDLQITYYVENMTKLVNPKATSI